MKTSTMTLGALAALVLAPALAARGQSTAPAAAAPVNDSLFAMAAAASGMAEVTTSRLALQRGSDSDVKKFAQQMVDDHSKANQELMALASAKRIALPQALSYQDQAAGEILNGMRGSDFDLAYAKNQHAAHICAVELFKAEAERGQDPDLKAFAARTLPHLKEHLRMAHDLCREEKSSRSSSR